MNRTLLFISFFFILTLVSCQPSKNNNGKRQNEVELVAEKQLVFPLDEQTYYLSKSMFQFEENGKEYLHFENTQKSLYDIVIFDIENRQIAKRIPLSKTGPNGLPAVSGSRPSPDSEQILISQNNIGRLSTIITKERSYVIIQSKVPKADSQHFSSVVIIIHPPLSKTPVYF